MSKAKTPKYKVYFRRRRAGVTNFAKRLGIVRGMLPRLVVRKSNKNITVHFSNFAPEGDLTILSVNSLKLKKLYNFPAKRNVVTAYLTALLAAKEVKKKGVNEFILDIGLNAPTKGGIVFAALKGALDAGLKTSKYSEEKIPMDKLAKPKEELKSLFEETKKKILTG